VFELRPCTLARMFSSISELSGPNIDFLGPQQRTLNPQKNIEIRFFCQNGGENYSRFRFSAKVWFSTLDSVVLAKNLKKNSEAIFFRYLESKLKNSKII